jgi:hypothetical protein
LWDCLVGVLAAASHYGPRRCGPSSR